MATANNQPCKAVTTEQTSSKYVCRNYKGSLIYSSSQTPQYNPFSYLNDVLIASLGAHPVFNYIHNGEWRRKRELTLTEHLLCARRDKFLTYGIFVFSKSIKVFFRFFYKFIYLFLAVLGLRFCARAFSSCGKRGPLFIAVRGPLTVTASLVVEHRLQTRRLSSCGSRA